MIYYDLPFWARTLDDAAAARVAFEVQQGVSERSDMADTIYFPTWMVGPMMQSDRAVEAKVDSPHCQDEGYKYALQHAMHKTTIAHVGGHFVAFHLCEPKETLYVWDWMPAAIVSYGQARRFLLFFSLLLCDDKYLTYNVVIYDSSNLPSLPRQTDSSSCGVFASIFLYHLFKEAKVHFIQEDQNLWRRFMLHKILDLQ